MNKFLHNCEGYLLSLYHGRCTFQSNPQLYHEPYPQPGYAAGTTAAQGALGKRHPVQTKTIRLTITLTIMSFSSGLLSAIISVKSTNALSAIRFEPSSRHPHYPVVAAIIRHGQKILCVQRGQTKYSYTSYHWEFPGGKVEAGESPQQALLREIREELGLEIQVGELCLQHTHHYSDFSISLSTYYCSTQQPEALALTEHVAYQWLEAGAFSHLTWAAADEPVVVKLK